ncbi:MAG: thioredoxin family protein [Candidatus Heimdallarchaeota archaeon]|nr:thioredoxin family protein [Candidatus Heimdallarchaeota archaeon]MCK5048646.1 thioredoxin family protein [Candidatus Heimdallarchaeota archaeon]
MIDIDRETEREVIKLLSMLEDEVVVHLFVIDSCVYCKETEIMLRTLADLSDMVKLLIWSGSNNKKAQEYAIDKFPGIIIEGKNKGTIRFFGIPSGYEYTSLVHSILSAGSFSTDIDDNIRERIEKLEKNVHIQIFVTPDCPYSPLAVVQAQKLASISNKITADMIEAREFKNLAKEHSVSSVPKIIIDGKPGAEGPIDLEKLLSLIEPDDESD